MTDKFNSMHFAQWSKALCHAQSAARNNAKALCGSKRTWLGTRRAHNAHTTSALLRTSYAYKLEHTQARARKQLRARPYTSPMNHLYIYRASYVMHLIRHSPCRSSGCTAKGGPQHGPSHGKPLLPKTHTMQTQRTQHGTQPLF